MYETPLATTTQNNKHLQKNLRITPINYHYLWKTKQDSSHYEIKSRQITWYSKKKETMISSMSQTEPSQSYGVCKFRKKNLNYANFLHNNYNFVSLSLSLPASRIHSVRFRFLIAWSFMFICDGCTGEFDYCFTFFSVSFFILLLLGLSTSN